MNKLLVYSLTIGIDLLVSAEYAEWPVNIWCIGLFIGYITTLKEKSA